MNRRKLTWLVALATLLLAVTVSAPAFPRDDTPTEPSATEALDSGKSGAEPTVETILRQQEQVLRGQHFAYEPEGRRDPFLSLMTPVGETALERPPGIVGMLVSELDLAGVVRDLNSGDVAMFIGSDNKGYFLRIGDEVFDGTVIAVDSRQGTVTFRQQVDDPRLIKPYRDVVKRLVPEEGTK